MADARRPVVANSLLTTLPATDFAAVEPHLEQCHLPKGSVLAKPGEPIDGIYFLTRGIGSVIVVTRDARRAEAGLFGYDGYVPAHAAAGSKLSPHEVVVQVEAEAYRLDFETFGRLMSDCQSFRTVVLRSVAEFANQLSYTAASNALHDLVERLARWLLMCHDRVSGNELFLTHDFIALMLGVRRPSVTTALHILEGSHFIRSERGLITIRDRRGLEEFAMDAYGAAERINRGEIKEAPGLGIDRVF